MPKPIIHSPTGTFDAADRQRVAGVLVYVVFHEVAEGNWGIFGRQANLAALRTSAPDAPEI